MPCSLTRFWLDGAGLDASPSGGIDRLDGAKSIAIILYFELELLNKNMKVERR